MLTYKAPIADIKFLIEDVLFSISKIVVNFIIQYSILIHN